MFTQLTTIKNVVSHNQQVFLSHPVL